VKTGQTPTELGQVTANPNPVLVSCQHPKAIVHLRSLHFAGAMLPNFATLMDSTKRWERLVVDVAEACPSLLGSELVEKLGFAEVASEATTA